MIDALIHGFWHNFTLYTREMQKISLEAGSLQVTFKGSFKLNDFTSAVI